MPPKRRFGRIRALPSGRFQARYNGPDGIDRPAPHTFAKRRDAEIWLTRVEGEIIQGTWTDPDLGRVPLGEYLTEWIDHRTSLRPRTLELYRWLYRRHIEPTLAERLLSDITPGMIRAWRAELIKGGVNPNTVAKAYRLLRTVFTTAVDDELVRRNPCRIKGAGQEYTEKRPTATVAQVFALAGSVPGRYSALVLMAAFTSLRYGELAALRRRDIEPKCRTVTVERALVETQSGELSFGPPKSEAGNRTVTISTAIRRDVRAHLDGHVADDPDALVFTSVNGAILRRGNFHKATSWTKTVTEIGLPSFHFHDLRHTGNKLAASTGASLADLMARMGHGSTRAAMIYQHASREQDQRIAMALSDHIAKERDRARNGHGWKKKRSA